MDRAPKSTLTSRPHSPERLEQRIVSDVEPLGLRTNPCHEAGACEFFLHERAGPGADPFVETCADDLGPALLLTARGGKCFVSGIANQVWGDGSDVVGDVDVFRESADRSPYLGQRRAALEHQVLCERSLEQDAEGYHDPDVLLDDIGPVPAAPRCYLQRVAPLAGRQSPVRRIIHRQGVRSAVRPSMSA